VYLFFHQITWITTQVLQMLVDFGASSRLSLCKSADLRPPGLSAGRNSQNIDEKLAASFLSKKYSLTEPGLKTWAGFSASMSAQ
jgi:hypothetical protein